MGHFVKFKRGFLKNLINLAINKAGSERKLASQVNIPNSSIYSYKFEKRNITKERLMIICKFLNTSIKRIDKNILRYLSKNWGKIKGGKNCVKSKIKKGTFLPNIEVLREISSERMKVWHREMKENDPEKYYKLQYKRFRKIGNKPLLKTRCDVKVRNKFEQEVVNFLFNNKFKFEYEPYINIRGKAYFPDIIVSKNNIIEITAWKHPDFQRIAYLKQKIKDYKIEGFKVYFYIPKLYRNFYKEINKFVISDLDQFLDLLPR